MLARRIGVKDATKKMTMTIQEALVEALEEALARYGKPEIFNTDQGSQGGLNRSSQRRYFERVAGTRR